eukprot:12462814-Alexandrium_andersonii.AAC.1
MKILSCLDPRCRDALATFRTSGPLLSAGAAKRGTVVNLWPGAGWRAAGRIVEVLNARCFPAAAFPAAVGPPLQSSWIRGSLR